MSAHFAGSAFVAEYRPHVFKFKAALVQESDLFGETG
jgi:hypothetical protein